MNEWLKNKLLSHTCSGLQFFLEVFWDLEKHSKSVTHPYIPGLSRNAITVF